MKLNRKHTPGPWATDDYEFLWRNSDGGLTAHLEAGPAQIYFTPHDTADRQRALNDARLIAAAPELLAALENIVGLWADSEQNNGLAQIMARDAMTAIAKAKRY